MPEFTRPATWEDVKVLDLEGLLKTKQVPRPKDQADAQAIERAIELLGRNRR